MAPYMTPGLSGRSPILSTVAVSGVRYADLVVGAAIGVYVVKEAFEILRKAAGTKAAISQADGRPP